MITCVCGLIGSGKSTFSKKCKVLVSELDEIGNKEKQIKFTLKNDKDGVDVYHVTCYPTSQEIEAFASRDVEYVWINTNQAQAMRNILCRGRERDVRDIKETKEKNREIAEKYRHSNIQFQVINIFDSGERW